MTLPPLLKADLRKTGLTWRHALHGRSPHAGAQVAERLLELLSAVTHDEITIAGYMTIGDELDCRPSLEALRATGAKLALPVAMGEARMSFRLWHHAAVLEKGPFGTLHPPADAAEARPDILLVPMVAFDKHGHRLGYGAGYYDRALADLRANWTVTAIGLAFDGQEIPKIPVDPTDQALDAVVTEARVLQFKEPLFTHYRE